MEVTAKNTLTNNKQNLVKSMASFKKWQKVKKLKKYLTTKKSTLKNFAN